jgi:hypothetical protein
MNYLNNQPQWTTVDPNEAFMSGFVYRAYYTVKNIPLLPVKLQEILIKTQMHFRKDYPGIKILKWQFEGDYFVAEFVKEGGVTPVALGAVTLTIIILAIATAFTSLMVWLMFVELRKYPRELVEKIIEGAEKASRNAMIAMAALAVSIPISLYLLRGFLFEKVA